MQDLVPLNVLGRISLSAGAVALAFSIEFSYGTLLLKELGVSATWSMSVWLSGPLAGLLVQPIIGTMSDECQSKYGRRRPFLLGGVLASCLSMFAIAFVEGLYTLTPTTTTQNIAAFTTVFGFWVLNFSNNVLGAAGRALLNDIVPNPQQDSANAMFAFLTGGGGIVGSYVASVDLTAMFPFFVSQIQAAFVLISLVLLLSILITCSVSETPLSNFTNDTMPITESYKKQNIFIGAFEKVSKGISTLQEPVRRVARVQFMAFMAWFAYMFYATAWFSAKYYPVQDTEELKNMALRDGAFALSLMGLITLCLTPFVPSVCKLFGTRKVYIFANLWVAFLFSCMHFAKTKEMGITLIASLGISWAVTQVVPFTIVAYFAKQEQDAGLVMGIHNVYNVCGQFTMLFMGTAIFGLLNPVSNLLANEAFFFLGGIAIFISAMMVPSIILPEEEYEEINISESKMLISDDTKVKQYS
eukprot:Nk52_evm9s369 gene=Nk52_evmTU9s369